MHAKTIEDGDARRTGQPSKFTRAMQCGVPVSRVEPGLRIFCFLQKDKMICRIVRRVAQNIENLNGSGTRYKTLKCFKAGIKGYNFKGLRC